MAVTRRQRYTAARARIKKNSNRVSLRQKENVMSWTNRKQAFITIVAAILAARKLSSVPPNNPASVAAIADAVSDARKIR
jgi:hypothetical protein